MIPTQTEVKEYEDEAQNWLEEYDMDSNIPDLEVVYEEIEVYSAAGELRQVLGSDVEVEEWGKVTYSNSFDYGSSNLRNSVVNFPSTKDAKEGYEEVEALWAHDQQEELSQFSVGDECLIIYSYPAGKIFFRKKNVLGIVSRSNWSGATDEKIIPYAKLLESKIS